MSPEIPDEKVKAVDPITEEEQAELDLWFTYHPPTPEQAPIFQTLRDAGHQFAQTIIENVPPSPDRTVAIRHVREAVMNANASLACYPEGKGRR
jgi:hypothetical protein